MALTTSAALGAPSTSHSNLTNGLLAYWQLDETSGTRLDDKSGCGGSGCDLADNNTVDFVSGVVDNAGKFTAANSEYLGRTHHADLSLGDTNFTIAAWVSASSLNTLRYIVAKYSGATFGEYFVGLDSTNKFRFSVVDNTSTVKTLLSSNTAITGTWHFVVAWHDASNDTVNLQVNNGNVTSSSWTTGVRTMTETFQIGARSGPAGYWDGNIDAVGVWTRTLNSDERTYLYNAGAGCENPFSGCEATHTPTFTPSATDTASATPTITLTPSPTVTPTATSTATNSPTPTITPTPTPTYTPFWWEGGALSDGALYVIERRATYGEIAVSALLILLLVVLGFIAMLTYRRWS